MTHSRLLLGNRLRSMFGRYHLIQVAFFFTLMVGCSKYTGDGLLIDNGVGSATDRYVLDLGPIDLNRVSTYEFDVENLPSENFVWGIQIQCPPTYAGCGADRPISAEVAITIRDIEKQELLQHAGPLHNWTWNVRSGDPSVFIYGRYPEPGTYFLPPENSKLQVSVAVISPAVNAERFNSHLIAKSGGWK